MNKFDVTATNIAGVALVRVTIGKEELLLTTEEAENFAQIVSMTANQGCLEESLNNMFNGPDCF